MVCRSFKIRNNLIKFYFCEKAATGLNRSGECIPITADITIKEKCQ